MRPVATDSITELDQTSHGSLPVQTGSKLNHALVAILLSVAFIGFAMSFSGGDKPINSLDFSTFSFSSHGDQTSQNTPGSNPSGAQGTQTPGQPSQPPSQSTNETSSQSTPPQTTTNTSGTSSNSTRGPYYTEPILLDSIPGGLTLDVLKQSGKRIKLDNPLSHAAIGQPNIDAGDYIPHLEIQWTLYGPDHLNVVIRDADKERFEIPFEDPYPRPRRQPLTDIEESNFILEIGTSPFSLVIKRKSTQEVIFELVNRLVYSDLYLEFTVRTPTNEIYGFGERTHAMQFGPGTYTLYIIDRSGAIDPGQPGYNTNGHQSLYLMAEKSKLYHLFLLRNTNSQEVVIHGNNEVTWKTIGGVLDFNFFIGDTPEEVIDLYHEYIGGWALPALWHLGSHQGKWRDYKTTEILEQVLQAYERAQLPLEALWSDLEYTVNQINLQFDDGRFPPAKTQELYKRYKKRWIPVIQFYIPFQRESYAWQFPDVLSVAIRDGIDPSIPTTGVELSGDIYFVDNWHPKAEAFWHMMYDYLDSKIPVSGLWLDANEVTNFLHINWPGANRVTHADHINRDRTRKYYRLPFYPGRENLYDVPIIDLDAIHYGDVIEYNVRAYNSLHQQRHAYTYLQKQGYYFPFVLTRGNTMGSGQFGYHFIPDINSLWDTFRVSSGQTYMYNIYGMPMVGPDICGMGGQTKTPSDLCARWYQVSTFYGFARNHHGPDNGPHNAQEPYTYEGDYYQAISGSIMLRYSFLKQYYALLFLKKRGLKGTGTFLRPVFFEFPTDPGMPKYGNNMHEDQFMVSDALLVTPCVYPGRTTVDAYIPNWRWFDMRDYKELTLRGQSGVISAKLTELTPHFLRGGRIFFKQDTQGVMRAADLSNKFTMIAALNDLTDTAAEATSEAHGHILSASDYEEKYIYENCALKSCMLKATVAYKLNKEDHTTHISLTVKSVVANSTTDGVEVNEVYVLGLDAESLANAGKIECSQCNTDSPLKLTTGGGWVMISEMKLDFKDGVSYDFKLSKE